MPAGTLKVSHSGARHSSYNCKHVGYRCKHVRQAAAGRPRLSRRLERPPRPRVRLVLPSFRVPPPLGSPLRCPRLRRVAVAAVRSRRAFQSPRPPCPSRCRLPPVFTSVTAMQAPVFTSVTVSVYICKPSVYICKQRDGGVAVAIAPAKYCGGKSGSDTPFCAAAVAVTAR